MAPPPKRKYNPRRGGGAANGSGSGTPGTPMTPRSTMAQQPKRPKVAETLPVIHSAVDVKQDDVNTVDVKQMYSTSAGEATAKPFSTLSGVLNKTLLGGLEKMGFESVLAKICVRKHANPIGSCRQCSKRC